MIELRANNEQIAAFQFYRWSTIPLNLLCMTVLIAVIVYTMKRDIDGVGTDRRSAATPAGGD
jgi:hypothetical protein